MNNINILNFCRDYAVLILIVVLMVVLTLASDAFLTPRNLLNILNMFIYSPKNDLSLPKMIRNDVATMPRAPPIIIAFLPATVG